MKIKPYKRRQNSDFFELSNNNKNIFNIFNIPGKIEDKLITINIDNNNIQFPKENRIKELEISLKPSKHINKKYEIIEKNIAIKGNEKINKINLKNNTKSIFDISLKYKEYMIKEDLISSCRKCQHNNCDKSNPLLKLCKCGYIHYNCLKSDLKKKIIKPKNENQEK